MPPLLPRPHPAGLPVALLALVLTSPPASAQAPDAWFRVRAQAVPSWTRVNPIPGGRALDEIRVVQPVLMLHAGVLGGRLRFTATGNAEGWTMPGGELDPGIWGEGFVDRRHPHTYVHELLASLVDPFGNRQGPFHTSVTVGKGFAPYGTDDPMNRPVLRYPVNHHWSQILERAVAIAAVGLGPLSLEAGLFNGDEPERPGQWPSLERFGDSWSARLLVQPVTGLELQGSHAEVKSPEHRPGAGSTQGKWSLSGRWKGPALGVPVYAMAEWARNSELNGFFVFHTVLVEAAVSPGRHQAWYRFERTSRPEEERTADLFRSLRPHRENSILGTSRWTIHTVGYGFRFEPLSWLAAEPFGEVSLGRARKVGGGVFTVEGLYGRESFEALTLGVRLTAGGPMHRMGRYGLLSPSPTHH